MIIVSFYTKNTSYERDAAELAASCNHFSLPHDIVPIDSLGAWDKNCCRKPAFLLQKLEEHNQPIVWVDADALIVKEPTLLYDLDYDLALYIQESEPIDSKHKVLTGTVYCNNTENTRAVLRAWDAECERLLSQEEEAWDQTALCNVLRQTNASLASLPLSYTAVFDCCENLEEAVIVHCQASRSYHHYGNREVLPLLGYAEPTSRERASAALIEKGKKPLEELFPTVLQSKNGRAPRAPLPALEQGEGASPRDNAPEAPSAPSPLVG